MHRREPVHFSKNICCLRLIRRSGSLLLTGALFLLPQAGIGAAGAVSPPDPVVNVEVNALLDAAEAAEQHEHLIYPASGSAMSLYHEVLYVDPGNADAITGLTRLAEHYLEQAQAALEKGELDRRQLLKADSLVSKARMIYPEYPAIATLHNQIELFERAERTRETLDWRLVAERSDSLTGQLRRLGRIAKQGDCRAIINVSNDAEGRWVFQKMNTAEGDSRVRARVKISSPAAVNIICFKDKVDAD